VCQEITERALDEPQRMAEQERQRRAFEQAPGFIIVMRRPEHTVESVNNAHRRLFASDDWTEKTIRGAFPGLADRGFFEKLDAVYAIGAAFEGRGAEVGYRTSLGSPEATRYLTNSAPVPIWVSNTGGARAFANQAYLRFLGVNYDEALVFD
jgi:PAS domain-containing protein